MATIITQPSKAVILARKWPFCAAANAQNIDRATWDEFLLSCPAKFLFIVKAVNFCILICTSDSPLLSLSQLHYFSHSCSSLRIPIRMPWQFSLYQRTVTFELESQNRLALKWNRFDSNFNYSSGSGKDCSEEDLHMHIDYYGECKELGECGKETLEDFPRRMKEWLYNIMK